MKSLIALKAFATNALATVGSTAAGKAAIVVTTVAVAGTSTAGVATMASHENKASEVQVEASAEVDESMSADVVAVDDTVNVSAAAADTQAIADEDNPVIGHRICFCGAAVAIREKTGLNEETWAWHILEAHGVKYDKFHNVKHADAYGADDPLLEQPVKPAEKPEVETPDVDAPVVDNGNINKPVEDNKVEVDDEAAKKAEEEAKKKAEEEAAKKAAEEAAKKAEEEAAKRAEEEAKKKAEEEARKKAEEEAAKKAAEEAAKRAEEEARKKAEEEAAKKAAEEAAKKAEEDAKLQEAIDHANQLEQEMLESLGRGASQNAEVSEPAVQ